MRSNKNIPDFLLGDYAFIFLFVIYFGAFYLFTIIYMALAAPGSPYHVDLVVHYNAINGLRNFMLHTSSWLLGMIGMTNFISGHWLNVVNGARINLGYPCLGISIMRFWWAIVLSYPQKIPLKIKYFFVGTIGFLALNIARFSLLAVVYTKCMGTSLRNIDHHTVFNCLTYLVLFFFLFKWLQHPILKKDSGNHLQMQESQTADISQHSKYGNADIVK